MAAIYYNDLSGDEFAGRARQTAAGVGDILRITEPLTRDLQEARAVLEE